MDLVRNINVKLDDTKEAKKLAAFAKAMERLPTAEARRRLSASLRLTEAEVVALLAKKL